MPQKETRGGVYAFASDRRQERDTKTSSGAAPSPRRKKAFAAVTAFGSDFVNCIRYAVYFIAQQKGFFRKLRNGAGGVPCISQRANKA
ncbi:MAG: hypothetical protein UFA98_09955 [Ruminococcus sp.]|nr:hypothetical protein [Ruminococcus sp.]